MQDRRQNAQKSRKYGHSGCEQPYWLTFDHPAGERQSLLEQVEAAEKRGLATYTLEVPGAWYAIEYGLVRSSGKKVP